MRSAFLVCFMFCVVSVFFSPASVCAKQPDIDKAAKKAYAIFLTKLDADKDKKLNRNEFSKVENIKGYAGMSFSAIDTNKDGFISEAEYVVSVKKTFTKK